MRRLILIVCTTCLSTAALAQEDGVTAERLQRLERDLNFLQKQVYRGEVTAPDADLTAVKNPAGHTELQEQLRQMRGEFERLQYDNRRLAEELKKLSADMDFRLHALEEQQRLMNNSLTALAASAPAASPTETPAVPESPTTAEPVPEAAAKPEKVEKTEEKPVATPSKEFANSNEHYNYAFKLMNAKNYSAAATSFDDFVHKYPSDPLTSNAYYWLGESYYARSDFTRSAESFRKGFEANPDGQKAPDNLYKLALSLANVKRVKESCVVLAQIISKYGDASPRIREKAITERTTLQCK